MTVAIAAFALLMAILKVGRFDMARAFSVFLALGAGQIHIATLAFLVWLFAENRFQIPRYVPRAPFTIAALSFICVILVTLLSPVSSRMVTELVQFAVYLFTFVMFVTALHNTLSVHMVLRAMFWAGLTCAIFGIVFSQIGITQAPHIYLGRGGNEGALFVLLVGIVPAVTLFAKTRNPLYLMAILIMLASQLIASSRANFALALLCLGLPLIFWTQKQVLRYVFVAALCATIYFAFDAIGDLFEQQRNYSTLQRLALYTAGWDLWLERPWTGWGWGSTSQLAPANTMTDLEFPHFHSVYIQFLVELGLLGWIANILFVTGGIALILIVALRHHDAPSGIYISGVILSCLGSGLTEALLFGADRALQLVLVSALIFILVRDRRHRPIASHPSSQTRDPLHAA